MQETPSITSDESIENSFLGMEPIDLSRYILKEEIGRDGFSRFYEITEKDTNQIFVAKILQNSSGYLDRITNFFKEVEILSQVQSPFVLKYYGCSLKDFKGNSSPTIINEFAPNDTLAKLIKKDQMKLAPPEWNDTKKLISIYGIASGMAYIHSKNINHHSLNTGTIYLDEYLIPKITHFELATFEKDEKEITKKDRSESPLYSAPEVFNKGCYTKASDVYSFSLIVYEIVTGKKPFENISNFLQFFAEIANGKRPEISENVPPAYSNLIKKCWAQDPNERPTFEEIISSLKSDKSFITSTIDEKEFLEFIESIEDPLTCKKYDFCKVFIDYPEPKEFIVDLDPIDLKSFKKLDYIGKGQFGKVFLVQDKETGNVYAAKVNIKLLKNCKPIELVNLSREITILSKLNSPMILKFIGYSTLSFSNKKKQVIITEYCENNSLDKIIDLQNSDLNTSGWTDTKKLISAYGIAAGMAYLHSKNILHRDLKPGNIFLDEYLFPKIGDFGLAIDTSKEALDSLQVGSPAFMAPEIIENVRYTKAGDVYAYAILLYQLITQKEPYKNMTTLRVIDDVLKGIRPIIPSNVPDCYKNLIEQCWSAEPEKRPTFDQIVDTLEKNEEFITEKIDKNEFFNYIKYINNNNINESFQQVSIDFEELKRIQERDPTLNVSFLDLSQFIETRIIHKGNHFKIYEVKEKPTQILCEAKISRKKITNLPLNEIIHLSREINILSQINHPSFLKFIGYSPIDFNNQPNPVIITEMPSNRSLSHLLSIKRRKKFVDKWDDTKKLIEIYGIASGMAYLHLHDVIHRNLCPESIFLDEYLFPKIGNFGLLTKIQTIKDSSFQTSLGIKGNIIYSSPELLKDSVYSKCSDVYSFAFVCYEILTLKEPLVDCDDFNSIFTEVVEKENRPSLDVNIPNCYHQLIEKCWAQNPEDRPTFEQIAKGLKTYPEFITENVDKDEFFKYVDFIDNSKIEFYSENRVVRFDDLIEEKSQSKDE